MTPTVRCYNCLVSFNTRIKDELARKIPSRRCCRVAELSAIIKMEGSIHLKGEGRFSLEVDCGHPSVARKTYSLMKLLFPVDIEIAVEEGPPFKKNKEFLIICPPQPSLLQVLNELGIISEGFEMGISVSQRIVKKGCCSASYLRGAFLSSGATNNPKDGYHLEIYSKDSAVLEDLKGIMKNNGVEPKISERSKNHYLYLKEKSKITETLALIGAYDSFLEIEDIQTVSALKNRVNRLVNCEQSNLRKTVDSSLEQLRNIEMIERELGLDLLPPALKDAALLRRAHPRATLSELSELTDPQISKSAVNHRLRRLAAIAKSLIN